MNTEEFELVKETMVHLASNIEDSIEKDNDDPVSRSQALVSIDGQLGRYLHGAGVATLYRKRLDEGDHEEGDVISREETMQMESMAATIAQGARKTAFR